jgi:hypothetical protein
LQEYLVEFSYQSLHHAVICQMTGEESEPLFMALFISAANEETALEWGAEVAARLSGFANEGRGPAWGEEGDKCRFVPIPADSRWAKSLAFLQHVRVGEYPHYERMTDSAYTDWLMDNAPECWAFEVTIRLRDLSEAEQHAFWDEFIAEAIDANNLRYGGLDDGFAEADDPLVAEAGRVFVDAWLRTRPEPARFDIGPLIEG